MKFLLIKEKTESCNAPLKRSHYSAVWKLHADTEVLKQQSTVCLQTQTNSIRTSENNRGVRNGETVASPTEEFKTLTEDGVEWALSNQLLDLFLGGFQGCLWLMTHCWSASTSRGEIQICRPSLSAIRWLCLNTSGVCSICLIGSLSLSSAVCVPSH